MNEGRYDERLKKALEQNKIKGGEGLGCILSSVGHRVKIHIITPATGKERGDVEIRDYVKLQKPRDLTDCLPPPRTLILDFTLTHTRFGKSQLSFMGQLTHTRRTDNAPDPVQTAVS